MTRIVLSPGDLEALIGRLFAEGFDVVGPTLDAGVVRLRPLTGIKDLPHGVHDEQAPGRYRTEQADDGAWFGYAVGPTSLKATLFPPRRHVWSSTTSDGTIHFRPDAPRRRPTAVIGARPCDVAAMAVQDRVLRDGEYVDPDYVARRSSTFIVVANCTRPAATCFCVSMGSGPAASSCFDLALTEILTDDRHYFLTDIGSEAGQAMLDHLDLVTATPAEEALASAALEAAAEGMTRALSTDDLPELLQNVPTHRRWASIADRCLSCANCTMVCPTCFCVSTEPTTELDGSGAGEDRRWDSCFSLDFSFMGGEPVRESIESRYRQWLTHKLSTWVDQFGTFGCVGCGRCITWCPVGIDLTEEIRHLREPEAAHA